MAEALVLRKAIIICMELALDSVTFKGESKVMVQAVNSSQPVFIEISYIVFDIQCLLRHRSARLVQFIYREANYTAHAIVKDKFCATPFE